MILVVEAVQGLRDGMRDLLTADGYRITTAKDEQEVVEIARHERPDLLLICPAEPPPDLISAVARIRERAELSTEVPMAFFCIEAVDEGEEVAYENNVYVISPDNFNHLRRFLKRLLAAPPTAL
ncbi:MAG: response regulator [Pyrinomonadaceae bacterium]